MFVKFYLAVHDISSLDSDTNLLKRYKSREKARSQSKSWRPSLHLKMRFHSHAELNSFSYEWSCIRPRFVREAQGNSEMGYSNTRELLHLAFENKTNYFELKEGKQSSIARL